MFNKWKLAIWSLTAVHAKSENWQFGNLNLWIGSLETEYLTIENANKKFEIWKSPTLNIPTRTPAPDHLLGGHNFQFRLHKNIFRETNIDMQVFQEQIFLFWKIKLKTHFSFEQIDALRFSIRDLMDSGGRKTTLTFSRIWNKSKTKSFPPGKCNNGDFSQSCF